MVSLIPRFLVIGFSLDYGDVIYYRDDLEMNSGLTKRLESVQYSAALAVAGA